MVDLFCFPIIWGENFSSKNVLSEYLNDIRKKEYKDVSTILYDIMRVTLRGIWQDINKFTDEQVAERERAEGNPVPSEHMSEVIEYAMKQDRCILYNFLNGEFIDVEGNPFYIRDKVVYFFSYIQISRFIIDEIKKNGGIPIISSEQGKMTNDWYKYFPLDRTMRQTTYSALLDNAEHYLDKLGKGKELFIKTVYKGYSGVYEYQKIRGKGSFINANENLNEQVRATAPILISRPLKIISDEYDTREWRVFVMNGNIQNISRQTYGEYIPIEPYVIEYIKEQVKRANKAMPINSYVIDFMEYMSDDGVPTMTVTEFNEIIHADIYHNNVTFPILKRKNNDDFRIEEVGFQKTKNIEGMTL